MNGWFLSENTGKEGLREAAEAIVANPEMQGIYRFQEGKQNSDAVNNFYTILENLPGDITRYYWVNAQRRCANAARRLYHRVFLSGQRHAYCCAACGYCAAQIRRLYTRFRCHPFCAEY